MAKQNIINYRYDDEIRREEYKPELVEDVFGSGGALEADEDQYNLFLKDPEQYSYLYGFSEDIAADENFKIAKKEIRYDADHDKLALLMRLTHPSDLCFKFEDGRITVPDNLSPAQVKALAQLLWFHNISGLELPDSNSPEFNQDFAAADAAVKQEYQEKPKVIEPVEKVDMPEEKKEEKKPDLKKIDEQLQKYVKRLGKDKRSYKSSKSRDEVVWRIYPDANAKDKDGKCEKGVTAHTYSIEIKARIDRNGVLNVSWNTPNAKKLENDQADEIINMAKNSGYTHFQLTGDITDSDKSAFRDACGRNGIVPLGFYPNEFHVRNMIDLASKSLSEDAVIKYKAAMAKQLRENIAEQGQQFEGNRLEKTIKNLEGAVKYDKFNSFASKKLLSRMMKINGSKNAVEIIAACQVYNNMLVEYGDEDNKLKDLSADELLKEFEKRLETQTEEVLKEIDERYREAEEENTNGKGVNMSDIIGTMTSNAKSDLDFTMSDIKGDCGIEIQRIPVSRGKFSYQDLKNYRNEKHQPLPQMLRNNQHSRS